MQWWLLIFLFAFSSLQAQVELCDDVKILDLDSFPMTSNEELILCGQNKGSYKYVPLYQKELYLKSYLQGRSYLNPKFTFKNNALEVMAGDLSQVEKVRVISEDLSRNKFVEKRLRTVFKKEPLNPSTLNAIENETKEEFKRYGYACIVPSTIALTDKDEVIVKLTNQDKYRFGQLVVEPIKGIYPEALDRFYPFQATDDYNSRLLTLTEKRMVRSEVVQASYFTDTCLNQQEDFVLSQFFLIGHPRTIRFGIGASTEVGPMFRFKWNNNRYKKMASKLEASVNLSYINQILNLRSQQFLWRKHPRRSWISDFTIAREDQKEFQQTSLNYDNLLNWTRDREGHFYSWSLGPSYEYGYYLTSGETTRSFSNLYLKAMFSFMDHDFEFFDMHPEEGNALNFDVEYRDDGLGFNSDVLKLSSDYTHFTHLMYWGKGALIGGFKTLLGTTVKESTVSSNSLPPNLKFYAGGSDDIRGFNLKSLPKNDGLGSLTKLGTKFELRKTKFILTSLELFTFYDLVFLGNDSWTVDKSYWDSVGVGLRWVSPIGMVQTFIANSYQHVPYENLGPYGFLGLGGSF